tara:strand:+ start:1225 stop:1761 length:537 start_codon:yes stop_codon:yes gene_type:complete
MLAHGKTVVGCSDEASEVDDFRSDFLCNLNTRSACTDDTNSLAPHSNIVLWPDCGVVDLAFEVAEVLDRRCVLLRGESNTWNEPPTGYFGTIRAFYVPAIGALIESSAVHVFVKLRVLVHFPHFLDVIEISSELLPSSISLLECKVLPELFVEELVNGRIAVDTSSWIAIPVPNSTGC